jgi:hypothetical protein
MKSEIFELPILICLFLTAVALFGDDLAMIWRIVFI